MKAVQLPELSGPEALQVIDTDIPEPPAGCVVVEVHTAGVTFPELLQTRGMYQTKHQVPFVIGSEGAGTVHAVGKGADFQVGDRVAFITDKGAWAQYAVAPATHTVKLPDEVSFEAAAGMPMNVLTADFALRHRGKLQAGQSVLVHGAAGGLGSALVQVALAMEAEVIAVVSTEEKAAIVKELGAQHVVLADGFKDRVKEIKPRGVDLVADPVGGDRFTDSLRCLATYGTLLVLGFTAGGIPEVKVNRLLLNNISVAGVGWGAATVPNPGLIQEQWQTLLPHVKAGKLNPRIHATFPLEDASAALAELDNRTVMGKILLNP